LVRSLYVLTLGLGLSGLILILGSFFGISLLRKPSEIAETKFKRHAPMTIVTALFMMMNWKRNGRNECVKEDGKKVEYGSANTLLC